MTAGGRIDFASKIRNAVETPVGSTERKKLTSDLVTYYAQVRGAVVFNRNRLNEQRREQEESPSRVLSQEIKNRSNYISRLTQEAAQVEKGIKVLRNSVTFIK